ncbi:ComEA family DNA-binding protein [Shewanella maritima]|uniref:ComEA family DNA-binding protein n=1 Tax=Shewanella maritima TaxID=2520507 RepID=UPI0037370E43
MPLSKLLGATFVGLLITSPVCVSAMDKAQSSTHKPSATKQVSPKKLTVNINKASIAELQQLKGVGESKAMAIVEFRQKHGKIANAEQLKQVKGIGDKLISQNAAYMTF